jgi:hypothetical protein
VPLVGGAYDARRSRISSASDGIVTKSLDCKPPNGLVDERLNSIKSHRHCSCPVPSQNELSTANLSQQTILIWDAKSGRSPPALRQLLSFLDPPVRQQTSGPDSQADKKLA